MRARYAVALALVCAVSHAGEPDSPRVRFDVAMLRNARDVDVSAFEVGHPVRAGDHDVEVWRNGELLGRRSVRFAGADAQPCIDADFVAWLGLAIARLTAAQRDALASESCNTVATVHPAASARHEPGELALHVSIPQALLLSKNEAADSVPFDAGITAFRLAYGASFFRSEPRDAPPAQQGSLRLDAGMNAGAWRLRHRSTHLWQPGRSRESEALSAHLERDVSRFDARLSLGDFHATGLLLDPVALRGVRFQSDDRMLPASQQHNAPTIAGVADTNARVQVHQAGRLLFDTTVPPGPFSFDDLRPLGRGGDLDVRVVETDGRMRSWRVPHSAMPGLLRAGRRRFGLAAGWWPDAGAWNAPVVAGAVESGVHDRVTLRAAVQATTGHANVLAGVALASRAGALSIDRMHASTARQKNVAPGAATRAAFTTDVGATTTLQLGASHAPVSFHALKDLLHPAASFRERQRFDATLHRTFGGRRQGLRLSVIDRRFHTMHGVQRSAQLGWSMPIGRAGASLQASIEHAQPIVDRATQHATLALTLPLRVGATAAFAHAHARAGAGRFDLQSGIGGSLGERNAWNLGVARADDAHGSTATTSGSFGRTGQAGRIDAGLSVSPAMRQSSVTAEGSLLMHAHGITFGPTLGDTIALVRAEHGAGAQVLQAPHVRLDRRGHALVPQLSPYRRNRVGVDVQGASSDVAFDWTERDVVPRAGAIIDVPLGTEHHPMQFVRIVGAAGQAPPLGARVVDANGVERSVVGREGLARVPAGNIVWFLEGQTTPCEITTQPSDGIPVATCPESG